MVLFLHLEGHSAAEIRCRLCRVYGDNVMSDSSVRDGCTKICMKSWEQGWHSIVTNELLQKFDHVMRERRRFKISDLCDKLLKFRDPAGFLLSHSGWVTTGRTWIEYTTDWITLLCLSLIRKKKK